MDKSEEAVIQAEKAGPIIDTVILAIDYEIIEHFSQHLYGSPHKAVEELVSNSFDAFARSVYVYLPGKYTAESVLVWDDGQSMGVEGLKQLWFIARSPKDNGDRMCRDGDASRKMIGKFGIGKLASYAVGRRITHLCRNGSEFLLVSVDYKKLDGEEGKLVSSVDPYQAPIIKLEESQARQFVEELFNSESEAAAFKSLFDTDHWTVAIITDLRKEIPRGRLAWLLGNGMPLRPDFKVFVDDGEVFSKLGENAWREWTAESEEIRRALIASWDRALKAGTVEKPLAFGKAVGLDPTSPKTAVPYVEFPYLGKVTFDVRLFEQTLLKGKSADFGRSYGFFLMMRDRLINPDDGFLLLSDPSFGSFYRSQFVIRVGDDKDLLADRERFRTDTPGAEEFKILQTALYRAARNALEGRDDEEADREKSENLLPTRSRPFYREPLTSLILKSNLPSDVAFNIGSPRIDRMPLGEDKPLAILSPEGDGFQINTSHPFYLTLERRFGKGKAARGFFRALDLLSVSERLLEGYLYDIGVADEKVLQVLNWRDGLFRELAESYERVHSELGMALINASYVGGEPFETALTQILNDMGFRCERDGASGKKDVLLVATVGPESYALSFEPKGSVKPLPNDKAEISGAASHGKDAGAEHAIVVAREFAGFGKDGGRHDAAVLKECLESEVVSVMTVEAIIELHQAVEQFGYPLDLLKGIFCTIETPKAKLERIRHLQVPTQGFDYKALLDDIWQRQGSESKNDLVPYKHVYQSNPVWKAMSFDDFQNKLVALETLAQGRILIKPDQREIVLRQEPTKIIEQIEATLNLPALDTQLLEVGQIQVLQLAGKTPIITNEARLLKAKH